MSLPADRRAALTAGLSGLALAAGLAGGWLLPPAGAAAAGLPPVPADAASSPLGVPQVPPHGSGGYAFLVADDAGAPVLFDPCRPVHWVEAPGPVPPGGREVVRRAFAELSRHTGLRFVEDGTTDERPAESRPLVQPARYGDRWAPVLVAWSTEADAPRLAGRVAGYAGPAVADDGGRLLVSGQVVLDAADLAHPGGSGVTAFAYYAVLHELGHLVGLAHVDQPAQLMYAQGHIAAPAPGDLRGLAAAGSGPCSTRDPRR